MKYCKKCVQPDTRPGGYFDENGICGACLWEEEKKHINWEQRRAELQEIASWAKEQKATYDCVIGVSGGKDSTRQALYMRDVMKLRPLLVYAEPCENTPEGISNVCNIKNLGFDVISLSPNPQMMRKLFRKDFFSILNPNRASEYCLHSSVYIIADKFDIPLVVNGENPGQTVGIKNLKSAKGDATNIFKHNTIKEDYKKAYGEDFPLDELFMCSANMNNIQKKGIKGVWLSNYMEDWGQLPNAVFSIQHGLAIRDLNMNPYDEGTYVRYSSLDHTFKTVNQLLKHIKLGFAFTTEHVNYEIRAKLITREEGIFLVKELDGKCGKTNLLNFCKLIDITENEFWDHANTFRGPMWKKLKGEWQLINPIWEQEPITDNFSVSEIMQRFPYK